MGMMSFKDIPILITKFLEFSTKKICKYPLLSGTLLVFFILHLFFPFAFVFSLCSLPFFLAALYLYTKFRFKKLPDSHRDLPSIKCETKNTPKLKKPYISPQMSRRRNFRAKIEDPVPNEQKPMFDSSSPMKHFLSPDESLDQDEHDFMSRNEKIMEESLNERKNEKNSENKSQEDNFADENEDVKARDKTINRIVGWNEDDQKNLMDLGLSEMERNQRLENLIARRRARKFLMAIRGQASVFYENELETVRKMAPVKTDNIPSTSSDEDPVPGSAPSVLLPTRNPFDIPYDPTEEKPNLTVDGFQQEFLGGHHHHQISRHESFTLGASFEIDKDRDSMRPAQRRYMDRVVNRESRFARLRTHPVQGDHVPLIEKHLHQQQDDPDEDESCSSANKDEQEPELSGQQNDTENTSDEHLHARKSQQASSTSSDAVENQRQKQEEEINSSSDQLLSSSSSSPIELQSSDGEVEMEKESIKFESREEPPQPLNNTMQQVEEEEVIKHQEPEVIEIGPSGSSTGGEDKSSVSVGNIEDEGGLLVTQSNSNEEGRDRRQRSCESLVQVVDNIPQEEEEESIFFVDNSLSMPPLSPEQASKDSRPTMQGNPEEIDNQQPPVEDESDTRNIQDDVLSNQTEQNIISDTRKYDDKEYINPFANSVEEVDVIETNTANGEEKLGREGDDIKEESSPEQLKLEHLLESRGVESQESQVETRALPIEQLISEPIDQGSRDGASHAPTDEQVNTKSGLV